MKLYKVHAAGTGATLFLASIEILGGEGEHWCSCPPALSAAGGRDKSW